MMVHDGTCMKWIEMVYSLFILVLAPETDGRNLFEISVGPSVKK
jgi:hypothetical protein